MGSKLDESLAAIRREFGNGSLQLLGDRPPANSDVISTGAVTLDLALGGGYPRGRIVEIFGPESSGKSTLLLHLIANAQTKGLRCAFIDAEHALDPHYAKAIGVDTDSLLIAQPDYGEQGLQIADQLIQSGEIGVVVVDSVAALTPRAEIEGAMGDQFMGLQPRMMSQAMRKLSAVTHKTNTLLAFSNQVRSKIGVIYGNPEVQPGGRALPFYASQRLDVRRVAKDSDELGNRVKVKVVKNKIAAPYQEAEFDLIFGKGIDRLGSLLDAATDAKIVERRGAYYFFKDAQLGQGKDRAREFLQDNPELQVEIEKCIHG